MQLRCTNTACNKLLAIGSGDIQIKCPRCKKISQFNYLTQPNAQSIQPAKGLHGCSKPQPTTPNH